MSDLYTSFVRRSAPRLLARAILLSGHRQDAEDAVQEAFLEAFRHWDRICHYESPEGWVDMVMRQRLFGHRRKWWARWTPIEIDVPEPPGVGPDQTAIAVDVIRALGLLPVRQREVVVLRCLYGLSYQEIAHDLRISVSAVGSNLAKARAKLATLLGLETTPDSGDPLVAATAGRPLSAVSADPVAAALRTAELWLIAGLRADSQTMARLHGAIGSPPRTDP